MDKPKKEYYINQHMIPKKDTPDYYLLEVYKIVYKFFKDEEKAKAFMRSKNLNLGGSSPITLIKNGRGHKVLKFVQVAEQENQIPTETKEKKDERS